MRGGPSGTVVSVREGISEGAAWVEVGGVRWAAAEAIAALAPHVLEERLARMRAVLEERVGTVALGVEDLHHSHNAAACVRTAEAMGLQDFVTVEGVNVFPTFDEGRVGAKKVTRVTERWLTFHRLGGAAALRAWADARGVQVWGAAPLGTATLADIPADRPVLVLFGNESDGLRADTAAVCDHTFRIPMHGFVESFNISVSVGIVLHDLLGRVRARGGCGLEAGRREALLARWLVEDVRAADLILARASGAGAR